MDGRKDKDSWQKIIESQLIKDNLKQEKRKVELQSLFHGNMPKKLNVQSNIIKVNNSIYSKQVNSNAGSTNAVSQYKDTLRTLLPTSLSSKGTEEVGTEETRKNMSQQTALITEACSEKTPNPQRITDSIQTAITTQKTIKIKVFVNHKGLITIKPSNKRLATLCNTLSTSIYDVKRNEWQIAYEDFLKIKNELKQNKLIFEDIPKGAVKILQSPVNNQNFVLEGDIYTSLLTFQKEAVMFALNRGGRVILADDMGLGKTIQALAIAYYYRLEWPLLIISPASLLDSWCEAVRVFLNASCTIIRGISDFGSRISAISYDLASKYAKLFRENNVNVVIADECHYLKSNTTKRTLNLLPVLQKASRLLLLSGTPAVSRPVELYPILSALDKYLFPSFVEYGKRYCNGRRIGFFYDYKGCTNPEELQYLLNKNLMIRRTKSEVLSQLPAKFRRQIIIQASKTKKQIPETELEDVPETSIAMKYKEAAELKIVPVRDYLANMLEKNIKFIVFCHHSIMMKELCLFCDEKNVGYIKIDGSTPTSSRGSLVKEYQSNEDIKIALLSITACCTGLTLTAGSAVVFAELYWNPGTLLQAEDRVHRIGQKKCVDIHYLTAKGTVDEYVWPKLIQKLNVLESLGIGKNELKKMENIDKPNRQTELDDYNIKNS